MSKRCPKCNTRLQVTLDNESTHAESCWKCGYWLEIPRVVMPMSTLDAHPPKKSNFKVPKMGPCPVVGCEGVMRIDSGKVMCGKCSKRMKDWMGGKGTTLAPLVEIDGAWWLRSEIAAQEGEGA